MTISTIAQTVAVTGVEEITVTQIEQVGGDYVREIRIEDGAGKVFFTLRLIGETADKIRFTTPELNY